MVAASLLLGLGLASAQAKPLQACQDEYAANKTKIDGSQTEAAFLDACQKGQELVSGATSVSKPAVPPAIANQQPSTPAKAAGEATKP